MTALPLKARPSTKAGCLMLAASALSLVPPLAYETASVRVRLRPDGVLHGIAKPLVRSAELAREDIRCRATFLGGRRVPYVLDIREMVAFPPEAKRCYTSAESTAMLTAMAFVVGPRFNRVVGNLLAASFSVATTAFPVGVFADEDEALAWARTHVVDRH